MFWENEDWLTLDADEHAEALALVCTGLPHHERKAFTPATRGRTQALDADSLCVQTIRVRRLRFYPDHWLYEFGVSVAAAGFVNRYESARAFLVVSPIDTGGLAPIGTGSGSAPHLRPALRGKSGAISTIPLDWSSGVIHQLNQRAGIRLGAAEQLDPQLAIEYSDFFVSFIRDSRSRELFLLLHGGTFARPSGIPRQSFSLTPFEQAVEEHARGGAAIQRRTRFDFIPESASSTDEPDSAWVDAPAPNGVDRPDRPTVMPAPSSGDSSQSASRSVRAPVMATDIQIRVGESLRGGLALRFHAVVLHENVFHRAHFEVSCETDRATSVKMLDDEPLVPADPALIRYQVDALNVADIPLLLLLKPRCEVTATSFLASLDEAASTTALSPAAWVENLRVSGDVNLQLLASDGPLRVRDVEFMGRVVLDECRRRASVIFERCRIAQSLEARNCVIDGDLTLCNTSVFGATADVDPLSPAVRLDGLRLSGSLYAPQMTVLGEFAAPHAVIRGRLVLSGVHQARRFDREMGGITMPNARVDAGIDLSPHTDFEAVGGKVCSRSRIEGNVKLVGLKAPLVDMRGCVCQYIDLAWARLDGPLDLGCFDPSPTNPGAIGNRQMRSIVYWGARLRGLCAREIVIAGAWFDAGGLEMIGAEIIGSLFARPTIPPAYRSRIGGSVMLSGAHIRGDADFDGTCVDGDFEMRTGSLGRLFVSMYPSVWERSGDVRLGQFAAEIGRLELKGVCGLGTISLVGVQIGVASGQTGGVLIEDVESRGDVNFYCGQREDSVFTREEARVRDHINQRPGSKSSFHDQASPRTSAARVRGNVEMRRLVTGGRVDLTNLKVVDGAVLLKDARIGTDLFARRSTLRGWDFEQARDRSPATSRDGDSDHCALALECSLLDLDGARINGDALLSGLNLSGTDPNGGNFGGRGLQVAGRLEFHAGLGCSARIDGAIDLTGARAAELSLPSGERRGANQQVRTARRLVTLEQGRFDKLMITRPIPCLNLARVYVVDWELGGNRAEHLERANSFATSVDNCIEILRNMTQMDRSVWIDVESKLRNEAQVREANHVYRSMRNQEPVSGLQTIVKFLSRWLYGYGTRLVTAALLWVGLWLALFLMLSQADNVKASDNVLLQLASQCRMLHERTAIGSGATVAVVDALPPRCAAYFRAIHAGGALSIEITAADLAGTHASSGYGLGDAVLLSLRYAIPFVGAFGDPDWVPAEQVSARIRATSSLSVDLGLPPSMLAAGLLLVNSLLLSFAAAFIAKRWLR